MNVKECNNSIIVSGVDCFNPALTVDCGQAFRWQKCENGFWQGVAFGHSVKVLRQGNEIIFSGTTMDEFNGIWCPYFDLETDYTAICETLSADSVTAEAIKKYYGIRILKQDKWETAVSFIISQQNNIPRIKGIIERLSRAYGENLGGDLFAFPTPEALSALSVSDFEAVGAGYRAKYLKAFADGVNSGEIDLEAIEHMPFDEAKAVLKGILGIGEKVATCILLYGYHRLEAFPLDVWTKRVKERYYPNGFPPCFNDYGGVAQQYLYQYIRDI